MKLTWKNNTHYPDALFIEVTSYWEKACGVKFYKDNKNYLFSWEVAPEEMELDNQFKYVVAKSFFPYDDYRNVYIFKQNFDSYFNKKGALIHELGHTLGFRHEQIADPNNHTSERLGNAECLTPFDPDSIMYYPKLLEDEKNSRHSTLSALDVLGARSVYGESVVDLK